MEGMRDDVLIHVVAQVPVETGADVLVDRLQLDEDQRQAVDEADEIGAAVVARRAQPGQFQLAGRIMRFITRRKKPASPKSR